MNIVEKLQLKLSECSKVLENKCKEYELAVEEGLKLANRLVAHASTLKSIRNVSIEDTHSFRLDPEIKTKLHAAIMKELSSDENALVEVLKTLDSIHGGIIKQCDKVSSTYQTLMGQNICLEEVCSGTTSTSVAEQMEALDTFRREFTDNHDAQMISVDYFKSGGHHDRFLNVWKSDKVGSFIHELLCIISG